MPEPLVVAVILNTNRRDDTLACLVSLEKNTYQNLQSILLDNRSEDGSIAAVQAAFPAVRTMDLPENLGYAGNNNTGIRAAMALGADWILVLNEDTVVDPDCVEHLCRVGESDPAIGIVGPMVYHHDEPGVIQSAGGRLGRNWKSWHLAQNERDEGQFENVQTVDWLTGCALLVRRQVIEQVGPLDERFFYYWEEVDWCLRAARRGWRIVHAPKARLWHKGVKRDYRPAPSVSYYNTRNRLLLMMKHQASFGAWFSAAMDLMRTLVSLTIKPRWRSSRQHRDAIFWGATDFLRHRWGPGPF
jgi:GT2 family glycosyltransferase